MRKFLGLAIIVALLSFVGSAHASVAVHDEYSDQDYYVGEASSIKIDGQDVSSDGSQVTIVANGHRSGVTDLPSSCTNLTATNLAYGVFRLTIEGTRTIALPVGTPGQMITIVCTTKTNVGAAGTTTTITDDYLSAANQAAVVETGWDDIAFDAALDTVTLLYLDSTYGWIIVGEYGVSVT